MTALEFQRLHVQCGEALRRYFREASRILDLLSRCRPDALTLEQRSEIQTQRLKENDAHERYQALRTRLFNAARIGYDTSQ